MEELYNLGGGTLLPSYDEIISKWTAHSLDSINGEIQIVAPCLAFTWEQGSDTPFFITAENVSTAQPITVRCYENGDIYSILGEDLSEGYMFHIWPDNISFEDSPNGICKVMDTFYTP